MFSGDFGESRDAGNSGHFVGRLEGFVLAGNNFSGAEVDVFYDAIVIEEDVYGWVELAIGRIIIGRM